MQPRRESTLAVSQSRQQRQPCTACAEAGKPKHTTKNSEIKGVLNVEARPFKDQMFQCIKLGATLLLADVQYHYTGT